MLIPNKGDFEDLEELKPISLVEDYTILAKVLANILKRVADKVIATTSYAFMEGRHNPHRK